MFRMNKFIYGNDFWGFLLVFQFDLLNLEIISIMAY